MSFTNFGSSLGTVFITSISSVLSTTNNSAIRTKFQNVLNASRFNGASTVRYYVTDSSGNVYVTGTYSVTQGVNDSLNTSGTTYTLPVPTTSAVFIIKYNSSGTLVGFTNLDGTGSDTGYALAVDSNSNVYVVGSYNSSTTVAINNIALNSTMQSSGYTLPASTTGAAFILNYDPSGTLSGFTNLDGTGSDVAYGVATDSSSNIYVVGTYNSSGAVNVNNLALNSTMQSSGYTLPATTANSMFLKSYNFQNTSLVSKKIYNQLQPTNIVPLLFNKNYLLVTSNIISADWVVDRWVFTSS